MRITESDYQRLLAKKTGTSAKPRTRRAKPGGVGQLVANRPGYICLTLPILIESEQNLREHWRVKARRVAEQKAEVLIEWRRLIGKSPVTFPATVKITRFGVRLLDGDNLQAGGKHVRDALAHLMGIDDGDPRVQWGYGQLISEVRVYKVEVEVRWEVEG